MRLTTTIAIAALIGLMALSQKTGQSVQAASDSLVRSVVENRIREAWEDYTAKKADAYAALLDDDFTAVVIDGKRPHDKRASVAAVPAGALNGYSLNDLKVVALGVDSALATYIVDTDGTMPDGKKVHGAAAVTEVWIKRAGSWENLRYHESALK
jgi:ketosteroid isomerase-like protein